MLQLLGLEDNVLVLEVSLVPLGNFHLVEMETGFYPRKAVLNGENRVRSGVKIDIIALGGAAYYRFPSAAELRIIAPAADRVVLKAVDKLLQNFLIIHMLHLVNRFTNRRFPCLYA